MVLQDEDQGLQLTGEAYQVDAAGLIELDRIEGVSPALGYHRIDIDVVDLGGLDAGKGVDVCEKPRGPRRYPV